MHGTDLEQTRDDGRRCLVVMYHYVRPPDARAERGIRGLTPKAFEDQLSVLCRDMEPIGWPDFYAWVSGWGDVPRRCFLLTFDDGLAEHHHVVLSILNNWRIHGVFFVPGTVLGRRHMLAAHAVHLLLATLGDETLQREIGEAVARLDPGVSVRVDRDAAARVYHYEPPDRAAVKYLINMVMPASLRSSVIGQLFEQHVGDGAEWARRWYVSWDQVVDLQSRGHTIGGHGYAHEPLACQPEADQVRDCFAARRMLENGLGKGVRPFCYPFGSYNASTIEACRSAGFVQGFSTRRGWVARGGGRFDLPRVDTIDVEAFLAEDQACLQS